MPGSYSITQSQSTPQIVPGMMDVYNQLVQINQQRYNNVLSAYQQGLGRLESQLGGIYGGYNQLTNRVLGQLGLGGGGWGIAGPAATAIRQQQAQAAGQVQQRMIDAGLGNTTVQANLAQQNALYAQQAYASLGSQLAQTAAGYTSQIGLAGLAARQQGAGMESGYVQGGLGHLGQQLHNPAGNMIGNYATSTTRSFGGYGGGGGGYGGGSAYAPPTLSRDFPALGAGGGGDYHEPHTQGGVRGYFSDSSQPAPGVEGAYTYGGAGYGGYGGEEFGGAEAIDAVYGSL